MSLWALWQKQKYLIYSGLDVSWTEFKLKLGLVILFGILLSVLHLRKGIFKAWIQLPLAQSHGLLASFCNQVGHELLGCRIFLVGRSKVAILKGLCRSRNSPSWIQQILDLRLIFSFGSMLLRKWWQFISESSRKKRLSGHLSVRIQNRSWDKNYAATQSS